MDVVIVALQIVACIAVADFLAGVVHWFEDSYGSPSWPVLGPALIQPNILHHHGSAHFTKHGWLYTVSGPLAIAGVVVLGAFALGVLSWQIVLVAVLGAHANEFHKWSHRHPKSNGRVITFFQRTGLVQSAKYHALHHGGQRNTYYCTGTVFVNPILEKLRFWRRLEGLILFITGLPKRADLSLMSRIGRVIPTCTVRKCQGHAAA